MKKSISVILCLSLVLCSLFSIGSVAFAAEASIAGDLLSVKTDGVFNDTITYTVSLKGGVNLAGAIVWAVYDPNVLEVVSAGQAQGSPISGMYTEGPVDGKADTYTIAYLSMSEYKNGAADTQFMQFTFKVKGTARPITAVSFRCREFVSDTPSNNIDQGDYEPFYTWTGTTLSTTHVVSATMFEGGVTVEWEPTIGATGYIVYKIIDGAWNEIEYTTGCSYTDYKVNNNNVYQYTVRAYNENGLNSSFEQGVSICYLLAPSFLWLSPSGSNVMASWTAADGVNTYSLYRRTINIDGSKGNWVCVGTTNNTSFIDSTSTVANWNNYEYAVCSVSGANESPKYTISQVYTNANPNVTLSLGSDGIWYCYTNGSVNYDYRGLLYYYGSWYFVSNGVVDWNFTGLTSFYGAWYYVENGVVNFNVTTLVYFYDAWYYVENGVVNFNATTLVYFYDAWYYVENGVVNFDVTTLYYFYGAWYYVENGVVNFDATTLVYFYDAWYYVENGVVNFDATTLVYFYDAWYYVENGVVNFDATTLVYFYGDWYYVENGVVNFDATTLVYFYGAWYYVENGVVNFDATTLVYFYGDWYYVENGIVNFDATTLVYFYGAWYYVSDGKVDWSYTGFVEHDDVIYYVNDGCCDLTFNGTIEENGNTYEVVDGVATLKQGA